MNIDTLNAYCGNELVSFPYLSQGRLNIHRTVCCCTQSASGSRFLSLGSSGASEYAVQSLRRLDSWTLTSLGWPVCELHGHGARAVRSAWSHRPNLTFDLRLDKITRRIVLEVCLPFLDIHLAEWRPQIVCRRLMYRPRCRTW